MRVSISISDTIACYCLTALLVLTLASSSVRDPRGSGEFPARDKISGDVRGRRMMERPCEEIYVVGEGETLHSISDKCGDPFIVERNPHIHDPDDVFPGLVIKITPSSSSKIVDFPR
ncbi:PREDICTED: uncharacterized protein LOC104811486 [Tarenaya hassleriana]|uniref:uncharacterized protein LOC104811486 n=1 Tax=Tarenaya hassleriana TaxID=28532 RepID=UPI00053CA4E7|nr:PREDICTED: uncharacterized protein LOC104811486 [Tarenaya hassleriana]